MKTNILVNRITFLIVCITVIASIFSSANIVSADSSEAGFYVSAKLPDNQLDKNISYFDLRMKPEQKQTVYVNIYNEKSEDMAVSVIATNASSNSNGIIDYTKKGVADESLKHPFEEIAKPMEETVTVPALGSKAVGVEIEMPKDQYDGLILGGLVFTEVQEEDEKQDSSGSVAINNVVSYALAVKLSETDKVLDPDLELMDVEPRTVNYEPVITHYISNKVAALSTNMKMTIDILDAKTGDVIATHENDSVSMAPNSEMPYSLRLKDTELKEGKYVSKVTIDYKDGNDKTQTAEFEKTFSVSKEHAENTNDYNNIKDVTPLWAKVLIGSVIILIIAVVTLIIILVVRKKRNVQNIK